MRGREIYTAYHWSVCKVIASFIHLLDEEMTNQNSCLPVSIAISLSLALDTLQLWRAINITT